MLHLVRHGRPLVDRAVPAHEWPLDPAGYDDLGALRDSGRLPQGAQWFSSPEPKALETAQLLTDGEVSVVGGLRELRRDTTEWYDDHAAVVRRAFADPARPAAEGWEPLDRCRDRVVTVVAGIREACPADEPLVLVGHGIAWTALVAALTGEAPDLARWESLGMPDLITVEPR